MRICLVLMYFSVGGLQRVVIELASGLARRGYPVRVVIIAPKVRNPLITELDSRVEIVCLNGNLSRRIRDLRRATRGGVVHVHFADGKLRLLWRLAFLGRDHHLITYHNEYSMIRPSWKELIDRILIRQFCRVIAVSEAVGDYCRHSLRVSDSRLAVIRNGIHVSSTQMLGAPRRRSIRPFELIVVGNLQSHKGHETVLRAIAAAREQLDVRLTIVGDGPMMAELYIMSRSLGIDHVVTWLGAVWPRTFVLPLLEQMDAFVSASQVEGLPLAVLEAMALGLPVLASDIPSHREILGWHGILVPVSDFEALAHAILRLASDPGLYENLSELSLNRVEEHFDVERFITEHVELYNSVITA